MADFPLRRDTVGMEFASQAIDIARAAGVATRMVLPAAAAVWLLLATDAIGRLSLLVEELANQRGTSVVHHGSKLAPEAS